MQKPKKINWDKNSTETKTKCSCEQNWNCSCKGDVSIYWEDVSNVFYWDAQQVLKDNCKSIVNKLIFGQLNINSLKNKFDMVSEIIKGVVDVFMISETKLDNSFPGGQFFRDGYHTSFRYDWNGNRGGILLYLREDIAANAIHCHFRTWKFLVEINLHQEKLLINCSYNPHKNNIGSHLNVITKTFDTYFGKYINVVFPEILMQELKKLPWDLFLQWLPGYLRNSRRIDFGFTPI